MFELKELPYDLGALEPYISKKTMEFHYGKHHRAYVDNLNKFVKDTKFEQVSLEDIIKATYGNSEFAPVFNNAAQVWNHNFFWQSMRPNGGGEPKPELKAKLEKSFGSADKFKEEFKAAAVGQFGSGWAWLVEDKGELKIVKTSNADTPIVRDQKPILVIDVWEHAYYLDYQNLRANFTDAFLNNLVNW